jgi:hypothetical protein
MADRLVSTTREDIPILAFVMSARVRAGRIPLWRFATGHLEGRLIYYFGTARREVETFFFLHAPADRAGPQI